MARRFHLFPFRTEKLSFATPMVLRTSGRVGSRRFTESLEVEILRGFFYALTGTGNDIRSSCLVHLSGIVDILRGNSVIVN